MVTMPRKQRVQLILLDGIAYGIPLCWMVLVSLAVRANALLGWWPRLYVDDPKQLDMGWHYDAAGIAILVGVLLTVLGAVTVAWLLILRHAVSRRRMALAGTVVALSFLAHLLSPLVSWYLD